MEELVKSKMLMMGIKTFLEMPRVKKKEPMELNRRWVRKCLLKKANRMENRWNHSWRWSPVIQKTWRPWVSWLLVRTQFSKTSKITWMTYLHKATKSMWSKHLWKRSGPASSSIWLLTTLGNTKGESRGCIPTSANLATSDHTNSPQTTTLTTKTVLNYCWISVKSSLQCE